MNKLELFKELVERSQNERRGLTVYLQGQSITGIVTRIIGEGAAVELASQQYHKAVVRLDTVEAMLVN